MDLLPKYRDKLLIRSSFNIKEFLKKEKNRILLAKFLVSNSKNLELFMDILYEMYPDLSHGYCISKNHVVVSFFHRIIPYFDIPIKFNLKYKEL